MGNQATLAGALGGNVQMAKWSINTWFYLIIVVVTVISLYWQWKDRQDRLKGG